MARAPQAIRLKKAGALLLQWPAAPGAELQGSARLEMVLPPRVLLGRRQSRSQGGP